MVQSLFDRGVQASVQPAPAPLPVHRPEDVGQVESFVTGAGMANTVAAGVMTYNRMSRAPIDDTFDPDFLPGTWLEKNAPWALRGASEDETLFDAFHDAPNEATLKQSVADYEAEIDEITKAFANTKSAVAGMAAGAIFDLTTFIPIAGVVKSVAAATKAAKVAARVQGAARIGAFGAADQAAFGLLDMQLRPTHGVEELLAGTAAGAVFGGLLGGAFPSTAGIRMYDPEALKAMKAKGAQTYDRSVDPDIIPQPVAKVGDEGDAGAARSPIDPEGTRPDPSKIGSKRLPIIGNVEFFRSIQQRVQNLLADNPQNRGVGGYYDFMTKIFRTSTTSLGEEAGTLARGKIVEDIVYKKYFGPAFKRAFDAGHRRIYDELAKDLGDGFMRTGYGDIIKPLAMKHIKQWIKKGVSRAEFDRLQMEVALRRAHGASAEDATQGVIAKHLGDRIDIPASNRLAKSLNESVDLETGLYRSIGDDIKKHGLDPEELIDLNGVYRPQIYFVDAIAANKQKFIELLMENQGWTTPDWFVEGHFPGQKFKELAPEDQDFVRGEFILKNEDRLQLKAAERFDKATKQLEGAKGEAYDAALARFQVKVDMLREKAAKQQVRFDASKTKAGAHQKKVALMKTEQALEAAELKLAKAVKEIQHGKGLEAMLKQAKNAGTNAQRVRARSAEEAVAKGEKKVVSADEKLSTDFAKNADIEQLANEVAENIMNSLSSKDSAYGFNVRGVDPTGKSARMHPRNIDWSKSILEGDTRLDEFLNMDRNQLLNGYINQMAPRIAFKEVFGVDDLNEAAKIHIKELPADKQAQAFADVNAIQDKLLGRAMLGTDPNIRFLSQFFRNINVLKYLGSSGLLLPADTALIHISQESPNILKTGRQLIEALLPGKKIGKFRNWAQEMGQDTLQGIVLGHNIASSGGFRSKVLEGLTEDATARGMGPVGSRLWNFTKEAGRMGRMGAEGMMIANGMNFWNGRQDMFLRMGVIGNMWDKGRKGFAGLEPGFATKIRTAGVTEKRFQRLMDEWSANVTKFEGMHLPDIDKMSKGARDDLIMIVENFSANGIIAPGLGEMPTFANNPFGAIMFQFQGFGFAAQGKFARVALQKGLRDPLVMQAMLFMFSMSLVTDMAKAAQRGELDDYAESWQSPEGATQHFYNMISRGPMAVASTNFAAELGINVLGRALNTGLERAGVSPFIPQNHRLREREWWQIIGGPGVSTITDMGNAAVTGANVVGSGEFGESDWKAVKKIVPGTSHILYRGLENMLKDD